MHIARHFYKKVTPRHARAMFTASAAMLMMLALGACGVSSTSALGAGSNSAATPTATTSAAGKDTSAKPCPVVGTSVNLGSPALVLTPKSAKQEAVAHVGDLIVVELPTTSRWRFNQAASAQLQPGDLQGVLDDSLNACVWSFHAQSTGTTTLSFGGSAVCESGQMCPQFVIALNFPIKVD